MCISRWVPVGVSNAPIATPMKSRKIVSQNNDDPQTPQKPRRTFAEDWYQLTAPVTVNAALATSVEANTWPDDLRQATQWQASGPFNAASR